MLPPTTLSFSIYCICKQITTTSRCEVRSKRSFYCFSPPYHISSANARYPMYTTLIDPYSLFSLIFTSSSISASLHYLTLSLGPLLHHERSFSPASGTFVQFSSRARDMRYVNYCDHFSEILVLTFSLLLRAIHTTKVKVVIPKANGSTTTIEDRI